eukprot:CAMPEP_0170485934 /NCGR_PEP_ID=MMETSP0208-20121228/5081_1 /TAXON_ID=197538 /ORGANISM="Strombidium inclinatum, Strain S3" /LENGTH=72 /DNA_ID=CAMNT_0010759741 /DNA_START=495 /DNA_END=709 /DNA_ORIENTATION=-
MKVDISSKLPTFNTGKIIRQRNAVSRNTSKELIETKPVMGSPTQRIANALNRHGSNIEEWAKMIQQAREVRT